MRQAHRIYGYTFVQANDWEYPGCDMWHVYQDGSWVATVRYEFEFITPNTKGGKITARCAKSQRRFYTRELYGIYHDRVAQNHSWDIYLSEIAMALSNFLHAGTITEESPLGNSCQCGLPEIGW